MLGVYRTDLRGSINAKHLLVEIPLVAISVYDVAGTRTSTAAHARRRSRLALPKLPALQSVRTSSA
jgi:hypothetical protein